MCFRVRKRMRRVTMFFWVLLLLIGSGAFCAAIVWGLPKIFLKSRYTIDQPYDRGIKKYKFKNTGYGIVYEPALNVRKYIKQYVLTNQNGEKKLMCKVAPKVTYIDYDIVLFDASNKVFLILNAKDLIEKSQFTAEVTLPPETAYVTILLNEVDGRKLGKKQSVRLSPFHLLCFAISSIGLSTCLAFCLKLCFANLFGGIMRQSFMASAMGNSLTLILSLVIGFVGVLVTTLVLVLKYKKK